MDFATTKKAARGRWREILGGLGVSTSALVDKHGPCPGCGGTDRFRFDDKDGDGTFICSQGGGETLAGDGFALLIHTKVANSNQDALERVSEYLGLSEPLPSPVSQNPAATTSYEYYNDDGELRYTVTRTDTGDGTKTFRQETYLGLPPRSDPSFKSLPYNMLDLCSRREAKIHIVEGEKCVEHLKGLGLLATCNHGGAGNWDEALNEYFKGRDVIILPDNDEPGRDHCRKVTDQLIEVANSVRICELPGLPEKGDVIDWLGSGNDLKELHAELGFAKLADDGLGHRLADLQNKVIHIPEPVHAHIPHGFSIIAGAPKAGKSTFMEWVAYEVSQTATVLYLALEYSELMAQQRFKWLPSSCDIRMFCQDEVPRVGEGGEAYLDRLLAKLKPKLTVIDTLAHFKRMAAEKGYEGEMAAMKEIKVLFDKHDLSCVCIHHSRKGNVNDDPSDPFQKILGSTALSGGVDTTMVLESKEDRTVLHSKGRLVEYSQKYFSYADHCFELDTSPGASLRGVADVQQAIVDYLEEGGATRKQLCDDLDIKKGNLSTYIKKLVVKGKVKTNGRGGPIELTRNAPALGL